MTNRLFLVILIIAMLGLLAFPAAAQTNANQCIYKFGGVWLEDRPTGLPCRVNGATLGLGLWRCKARAARPECAPQLPTRCLACGEPIDLTSGNTYIDQTDVALPGLGGGLMLSRTWNSRWALWASGAPIPGGMFGRNWRSTYDEAMFSYKEGMGYARADGTIWFFAYGGNEWPLMAPANGGAVLKSGDPICGATGMCSDMHWIITFKNGEQRVFDITSGFLLSITDRNGKLG
jgi:hypothetical protein